MKRVLIAPLDWGLGHATRCIPIIQKLLERKCEVIVAGSGSSLSLLKHEFPSLLFLTLPAYAPRYAVRLPMVFKMALQLPRFIRVITQEHKELESIVSKYKIDLVISDNRYGCWSSKVSSVFITHQSNILMPKRFGWAAPFVRKINEGQMKKFKMCWIPDDSNGNTLAGNLISFGKIPSDVAHTFIGALSRFKRNDNADKKYDIVAICSGPEPQRTILENLLANQLKLSSLKFLLIRGVVSDKKARETLSNGEVVNFLSGTDLELVLQQAELVIARSGYSTLMDMMALGKHAIFIPTPGQTEQEYLAKQCLERQLAFCVEQKNFDLVEAIGKSKEYKGFGSFDGTNDLVDSAIDNALKW